MENKRIIFKINELNHLECLGCYFKLERLLENNGIKDIFFLQRQRDGVHIVPTSRKKKFFNWNSDKGRKNPGQ